MEMWTITTKEQGFIFRTSKLNEATEYLQDKSFYVSILTSKKIVQIHPFTWIKSSTLVLFVLHVN